MLCPLGNLQKHPMNKNPEIIRTILMCLEGANRSNIALNPADLPSFSEQDVAYYMRLLQEAGYITSSLRKSNSGEGRTTVIATGLTTFGHQLLDRMQGQS